MAARLVASPGPEVAVPAAASSDGLLAKVGSITMVAAALAEVVPTVNTSPPLSPLRS